MEMETTRAPYLQRVKLEEKISTLIKSLPEVDINQPVCPFCNAPQPIILPYAGDSNQKLRKYCECAQMQDYLKQNHKLSELKEQLQIIQQREDFQRKRAEKLFEERLMDEEGLSRTSNQLISVGRPIVFDEDRFIKQLPILFDAAYEDREEIREIVKRFVSTYHPAGKFGSDDKGAAYEQQMMAILAKRTSKL